MIHNGSEATEVRGGGGGAGGELRVVVVGELEQRKQVGLYPGHVARLRERLAAMGAAALETFRARFTIERSTAATVAFIEDCLAGRRL